MSAFILKFLVEINHTAWIIIIINNTTHKQKLTKTKVGNTFYSKPLNKIILAV